MVGDPAPARAGRHGLEIVTSVARHFEVRRESVGKRVTARIALVGQTAHEHAPAREGRVTGVRW